MKTFHDAQEFNPFRTGLRKGINLIEASAGTGKTYAIAMLVLRFIVEQEMSIEQLLVVTFTKAATEELKDRIRSRLVEARQTLTGYNKEADPNVSLWLEGLAIDPALIKRRLDLALLDIDQAGIFTIHGFCQRVLKEHALESGQLFDSELTGDIVEIKQACADDFWRTEVYRRSPWEASLLTSEYKTPDELLASIDSVADSIDVFPAFTGLDEQLANLRRLMESAKTKLEVVAETLQVRFPEGTFKKTYCDAFERALPALRAWMDGDSIDAPDAEAFCLFTNQGLNDALNGNKFRKTKERSSEDRKAEYLAGLALETAPFDKLAKAFKDIGLVFRRALLEALRHDLDRRMQRLNVLSFDDLIMRLAQALQSDQSALLIDAMQQRFQAALIDEFQDTDQNQWFIFSALFSSDSQFLYLIGDPKQAIYKFRGADIFSYLDAQNQAQHHFTLAKNWRSHPHLVAAVNDLFRRDQAFLLEALKFHRVEPGKTEADGCLINKGRPEPPMQLWQLTESESGFWTAGKAADAILTAVVNEIVQLLNGGFSIRHKQDEAGLKPKDIAILVRTNTQAREYQAALREAGVPSVLNSTESVFATPEATALYVVLQAVAHPGDMALLKQALALDWFGLDGQTLYQTLNQETVLDAWMSRFLNYYQDWQSKGLMTMMLHLMAGEGIRTQLSKSNLAERQLTNLHHLVELLQQAAKDEHLGINKTLEWLRSAIVKAVEEYGSAEEQQLRLESDDEAVKIVTMHRSKGLEYPVVFCPFLWQRSGRLSYEQKLIVCHEQGRMVADLGSPDFERRREQAIKEELAEDLRLFYVAVTRAKYRCYVAWADVRTKEAPNRSALAWLLEFADKDFEGQRKILQGFAVNSPAFGYRLLDASWQISELYRKPAPAVQLKARKRQRALYTTWQMSSYTALSALSQHDAPELPEDKAQETVALEAATEAGLPKGAQTGNAVHDLLEHIDFRVLAEGGDISAQRDQSCLRYGVKLEQPEMLDQLLRAVVSTPLDAEDPHFCLMNLKRAQCLKEMPFYLVMQPMNAAGINDILSNTSAFQPLTSKQMQGYLTGFIDLVCEYNGRYYVMDYKTNALPDYRPETLTEAMREHNYGLQYWLYTVVLHLYLQKRLDHYDYELHFGGVRYLFVRGMRPAMAMSGVYEDRPDLGRIEALSELFNG
ncbi:MAG: exodeoxyribonuclease V subunit beta [Gammaproteobacteria bacterium]